jgi:hypothetical protein
MGNVAGFEPVLVMDVGEHAFLLDYKPAERSKYIDAFFSNIDWNTVEERVQGEYSERVEVRLDTKILRLSAIPVFELRTISGQRIL